MEEIPNSDEMKEIIEEPLLGTMKSKELGGIRTLPFIIANEAFEKVASFGLSSNMILYLEKEYHMGMISGTNIINIWSSATNFLPVIGAFLADSFVGRYPMIGFGSVISLLGMILLWSTTMIPQARPPPCIGSSTSCSSSTAFQVIFLCFSFGLMSIGAGGIRSSSLAFGADQLIKPGNLKGVAALESYFGWYYACASLAVVISLTCVVYIQDHLGWEIGFGVPVVLMFLSALSFFLTSTFYIKLKDKTSLHTGFVQVIVAAYKNRHFPLASDRTSMVYHHKKGSSLVVPSQKLRCLNKACLVRDPRQYLTVDGRISNSWSLCTVDQVEELKALLKVIPMWSTGLIMSVTLSQPTFQVVQAMSMDRHVTSGLEIPAGSFGMFTVISITLWIVLYDRLILPLASRIMGRPVHLTAKQRMGIGLFLSIVTMVVTAIIEYIRRGIATKEGFSDDPQAVVNMSAMWLILPTCLGGIGNALNLVAQNEFYYSEFPQSMSSIATTLQGVGMSAASLLASFILNIVDNVTKSGGQPSWVSSNINQGHYDYYYWVLASLCFVNMLYFLLCSWAYGPCEEEDI